MGWLEDAASVATFGATNWAPPLINSLTGKDAADAAERAALLQGNSTDRATAENARQFDIGQQNLAPWLSAGKQALGEQQTLLGLNGDSSGALRSLQSSPGYQFRLNQGKKQLNAGLSARGGMGSGKSLVAGTNYNQDYAATEYGNRLNQLAGVANTGQTTGNTLGQMGSNYAQNQGNLWANNANAQGAAGIAGANARQSGISNIAKLGLMAWGASDRRLKTDITRIGTHKLGIGLYRWTYIDMPEDFPIEFKYLANWGGESEGVMANEVKQVMPEAVAKVGDYDVVNYSMLGGNYAN